MKFIDLFCGIGGFHLALAARGHECVFASDIDRHCREAYEANFGLEPAGDITEIAAGGIPAHDILCGGFPCQPFSLANLKARGFDEARGTLFFDIARIAEHHRPRILLLENVPRILAFDSGKVKRTIDRVLDELGYNVTWLKLNAAEFGAATARLRVYIVATLKDSGLTARAPVPDGSWDCIANHLRLDLDTSDLERPLEDYHLETPALVPEGGVMPRRIGHALRCPPSAGVTGWQGTRIYDIYWPAPSMTAGGHNEFRNTEGCYVNGVVRKLHIEEAKTIQGYPPEHVLSPGVAGYNQIGNSVIPKMVGLVFDAIEGIDGHA